MDDAARRQIEGALGTPTREDIGQGLTRRAILRGVAFAPVVRWISASAASVQSARPIRIGYSISLTGPLAANGKSLLLAHQIWADNVNVVGGLLGRRVEFVFYDDQSNPSMVPGIYTKLLDIDEVDLVVGFATNMLAAAMSVVMQHGRVFVGTFGLAVNSHFNYPRYFAVVPSGPDPKRAFSQGFFDLVTARSPQLRTVAIVAADTEFSRNASDGARDNARALGLKVLYDRSYPPTTADFSSIVRGLVATSPDIVFVASYPADSVGIVRAAAEVGLKAKLFGGAMVGLQTTAIKTQLGPLLNGIVNFDFWLPVPTMLFPGVVEMMAQYHAAAVREQVDPLGYYIAPWAYAQLQVLQQAIESTGSLDDERLAVHIRSGTFPTVVGDIEFGPDGEWAKPRVLLVQFQHLASRQVSEFADMRKTVILSPSEHKTGELIFPYAAAKRP